MFVITSKNKNKAVGQSDQANGGGNAVLERQPVPISKWRNLVRGYGPLRRLNLSYNQAAEKYIVDNCPH